MKNTTCPTTAHRIPNRFGLHRAILGFLFTLILFACTDSKPPETAETDLDLAYAMACEDASTVSPDEIVYDLTAITAWNEDLIWEDGPGSRVLVVSWVTEKVASYYLCPPEGCAPDDTCREGRECPEYRYDTWVTVAPELQRRFANRKPSPMRLAQILGLPPGDAERKAYMLEMYVRPQDLFRPCPDPEITDCQCELDFPPDLFRVFDSEALIYDDQEGAGFFTDYISWFTSRTDKVYTALYPYPWTRLGYTYDWGNTSAPFGLSEFVVHGKREDGLGIPVKINRVCRTEDYFMGEN